MPKHSKYRITYGTYGANRQKPVYRANSLSDALREMAKTVEETAGSMSLSHIALDAGHGHWDANLFTDRTSTAGAVTISLEQEG